MKLKEVHVEDNIRKVPKLASAVETATSLLEEETGPTAADVSADWIMGPTNTNGPGVRLRLASPLVTVEGQFSQEELANQEHMPRRLNRLWDSLLREIGQKHHDRLREMLAQISEE